ncbi:conjugal transfer protein TraC [Roseomonas nepalensis]|uniref:Conjugal transfer protein TraC n=1 Tax=Muricoccus nepalensis TaxID=1854500 RepID=A0A502ESM4_9PROT|nr:conjugal transfer protein TraD [Roseomonas nepalensis]TPG39476.1 conjugal transfer protein TraC [Roseomonas nepalensis]
MARKPRDYDAELLALGEKAKQLRAQKITKLGELVQRTGADTLPADVLAGALLEAVERHKAQPDSAARLTERGAAFFRRDKGNRGGVGGSGDAVAGTPAPDAAGPAVERAAE